MIETNREAAKEDTKSSAREIDKSEIKAASKEVN